MKFKLSSVSGIVNKEELEKLNKCGFKFKQSELGDEEFLIWDTSEIEINTIEELISLIKNVGSNIIVGQDSICLYDDYI